MIEYRGGYKYQLATDYELQLPSWNQENDVLTPYIRVTAGGRMRIRKGYAWDGPSGPTIDTRNFMRGSLVHDALYQLIREGWLPLDARLPADQLLRALCREDGMSAIRAWWVYQGVRWFARSAALPSNTRPLMRAP